MRLRDLGEAASHYSPRSNRTRRPLLLKTCTPVPEDANTGPTPLVPAYIVPGLLGSTARAEIYSPSSPARVQTPPSAQIGGQFNIRRGKEERKARYRPSRFMFTSRGASSVTSLHHIILDHTVTIVPS